MTFPFNIEKLPGLDTIAAHLEGLEETIISKLIDRAQFAQNLVVYEQGKSGLRALVLVACLISGCSATSRGFEPTSGSAPPRSARISGICPPPNA